MLILFKQTEQDLNMIFVNVIDFIVIREKINETDMNEESQLKIKLSRGDILVTILYKIVEHTVSIIAYCKFFVF